MMEINTLVIYPMTRAASDIEGQPTRSNAVSNAGAVKRMAQREV